MLNPSIKTRVGVLYGEIAQWFEWSALLLSNSSEAGLNPAWVAQEKFNGRGHTTCPPSCDQMGTLIGQEICPSGLEPQMAALQYALGES